MITKIERVLLILYCLNYGVVVNWVHCGVTLKWVMHDFPTCAVLLGGTVAICCQRVDSNALFPELIMLQLRFSCGEETAVIMSALVKFHTSARDCEPQWQSTVKIPLTYMFMCYSTGHADADRQI